MDGTFCAWDGQCLSVTTNTVSVSSNAASLSCELLGNFGDEPSEQKPALD